MNQLKLVDGYVLYEFESGKKGLVDTGSPVSIGEEPFVFKGRKITPEKEFHGLPAAELAEMSGQNWDCLIGLDALAGELLDFSGGTQCNHVVLFEQAPNAAFVAKLVIENRAISAVFDTGAPLTYLPPKVAQKYPCVGMKEDFYPGVGPFTTALHRVPVTLDGFTEEIDCGYLPYELNKGLLHSGHFEAILGTELLFRYSAKVDLSMPGLLLAVEL